MSLNLFLLVSLDESLDVEFLDESLDVEFLDESLDVEFLDESLDVVSWHLTSEAFLLEEFDAFLDDPEFDVVFLLELLVLLLVVFLKLDD